MLSERLARRGATRDGRSVGTCQMAGEHCPETETEVLRITGVGDRRICGGHVLVLDRLGMHYRRLDDDAPKPAWRQRSLARDESGTLS